MCKVVCGFHQFKISIVLIAQALIYHKPAAIFLVILNFMQIWSFCNWGDAEKHQDGLHNWSYVNPLKICQLHKMVNVAGIYSLQCLFCPWARQQLNHFWISKEPDELRDWPHKGFREGHNTIVRFTFLANCISDPIKCPAWGPKMLWVFKGRFAESTKTGIFVNFNAMSSEPTMSCKELDEIAKGWATKLENSSPPVRAWEPLLSLISIR